MNDETLADRIRRLVPNSAESDWAEVERLADIRETEPPRRLPLRVTRRRVTGVVLVAALAAAAIALIPARIDRNDQVGQILGNALAAVSAGPILHIVLSADTAETIGVPPGTHPHFTVVNLKSGAKTDVVTKEEIWYDAARHLWHEQISIGGGLHYDVLVTPKSSVNNLSKPGAGSTASPLDPALAAFFSGYEQALKRGNATIVAKTTIDGRPVEWLRFHPTPRYQAAEEIAVDATSLRPLFLRTICTRCTTAPPTYRIDTLEGIDAAEANFTKPTRRTDPDGRYSNVEKRQVPVEQASRLLRHRGYWAGRTINGIPLTAIVFDNYTRHSGTPVTRANVVGRGLGLTIYYGATIGPSGGLSDTPGKPNVAITETTNYIDGPGNFNNQQAGHPLTIAGAPLPPPNQIALSSLGQNNWDGQLRRDGLYIEIFAPTAQLVIATAKALTAIP